MTRDWDESEHPRHPARAPDSRGGQFAAAAIHKIMAETMGGGWIDQVSRRLAGDRYRPGGWVQQSRADYRFALENELAQDLPQDVLDELFDDYDWPAVVWRNGDHVVTIHDPAIAQRHGATILAHLDELQTRYPVRQKIRYSVIPDAMMPGARGAAFPNTGIAYSSESAFGPWPASQPQDHTMPVGRDRPDRPEMWRYSLTHEWGHLLDPRRWPSDASPLEREVQLMFHEWREHISEYGNTDEGEAFAEAFAEFALTGGDTDNPAAHVYARRFGWSYG